MLKSMELSRKKIGNGSILIEIREELDLYAAMDFKAYAEETLLLYQPEGIILSLKEMSYIDSSGIGVLLSLLRRCHKVHCKLLLCALQPQCKEVIQMTYLHKIFPIAESEFEALKAMNRHLKKSSRTESDGPIISVEKHPLLDTEGLHYKCVNIDLSRIRHISHVLTKDAPENIKEHNLLEQQVSEIIKNAVRHGNMNDISKEVHIWWRFSPEEARLIVEDQGKGFRNYPEWNRFYRQRMESFIKGDPDDMMQFLSYRGPESTPEDGGNALFATMEYWNNGFILNKSGNKVALKRRF